MSRAVSIVLGCMMCVTAASLVYAQGKREAAGYWMQRAASCWASNAHPFPPEAH